MLTLLENARVLTPQGWIERGHVLVQDGRITDVGHGEAPSLVAERTDLAGLTLVPGFVDLHVHGGSGFSLATTNPDEVRSYARWAVRHGVTAFLATVVAASVEEGLAFSRTAAEAAGHIEGGAELLGVNLEGPFVSSARQGALPDTWITAPQPDLFRQFREAAGGKLRIMTLAPEAPGALEVLRAAVKSGVVVSLGHSAAGHEEAQRAFRAGARHVTHALNAMSFHHREPGIVGAAVESQEVTIEVVADGAHLHPAVVRMLVSALGPGRVALVTDAVPPAGLAEGVFRLGGREARSREGKVTLPNGTLAGSAATMDALVRNCTDWGVPVFDALSMASATPARVLGLQASKGTIAPGYDADLAALDGQLRVAVTWIRGQAVFDARG